jgi:hypothetical protein
MVEAAQTVETPIAINNPSALTNNVFFIVLPSFYFLFSSH